MKKILVSLLVIMTISQAQAQFSKVSLQASGLTCSMCSKAVKEALEEVSFVDKVQVDIKNQQYNLSFKPDRPVDFDALSKAVVDAGFSVASLKVTMPVQAKLVKDQHLEVGGKTFHFLNASGQVLSGPATITLVDKGFVSAKEFKKWSAASKMPCVATGKMAACCTKGTATTERVYHVVI